MPDFDSVYAALRDKSDLPRLFQSMIQLIDEMIRNDKIESLAVQSALERIKCLLEANQAGSYASLCGVLWNLKFYQAAIRNHVSAKPRGRTLMALIDDLEAEIRKNVRPKLMRRSAELLTNREQLQSLRDLNPTTNLELPGSGE